MCEITSACPESVSVPIKSKVNVEIMTMQTMMKFRNVWTAMISWPGLLITDSTQMRRVKSFTKWMEKVGSRKTCLRRIT